MSNNKSSYFPNWKDAAAKNFNMSVSAIMKWHKPPTHTPIMLSNHNKLMDWLAVEMSKRLDQPIEITKEYINERRIGFEKCLEK